ncbi:MAG TPA: ribose-phosphate pyrophosphokinase [Bacteroidetes bacterium]|nr:ribose-phosphate pyrophosphokinase [Bacteroidota bacterium]
MNSQLKVFSGSSNSGLASKIAADLGVELGSLAIRRFSDQEIWVKFNENIRGSDVFIVQTTNPPAENILELLIMIDAASRASARRITAVIPYFGYARQDRKDQPRVALTSKLIANLLTSAGVDRVVTMDLHASQIQGFFDIPLDHLYGSYVFSEYYRHKAISNLVVASPDIGSLKIARAYAKRLKTGLAVIDKRRPKPNKVEVMNVIGEVEGKNILFVDDLVDTAETLTSAARAVKNKGAKDIYVACTHALLSGEATDKIMNSQIKEITVTDSLDIPDKKKIAKLIILSVSSLFAQAIDRIHNEKSISILFDIEK